MLKKEDLEIGKKVLLVIGKTYATAKVSENNSFWVDSSENGLVKGVNNRWVIHPSCSPGRSMMKVLNDVPFALGESEFVITTETANVDGKEKNLYYLEIIS